MRREETRGQSPGPPLAYSSFIGLRPPLSENEAKQSGITPTPCLTQRKEDKKTQFAVKRTRSKFIGKLTESDTISETVPLKEQNIISPPPNPKPNKWMMAGRTGPSLVSFFLLVHSFSVGGQGALFALVSLAISFPFQSPTNQKRVILRT